MTSTPQRVRLTAAEQFWYLLQCIAFGAGYLSKVPVKKALSEVGLAEMTDAERVWYILECIAFGAGYFTKVPVKKALSEMAQAPGSGPAGSWPGQTEQPQLGQPQLGQPNQPGAQSGQSRELQEGRHRNP